jgi:hypothetical protein
MSLIETVPPPEKLETQNPETLRVVPFQFLISLLHYPIGWRANHTLRTRPSRAGCNPTPSWAAVAIGSVADFTHHHYEPTC